jgi:hypothetical protein
MSSIYNSVPLNHDRSCTNIRVIEILGRDENHPDGLISCKFQRISLENAPPYTALSYTWGPPDETKRILLNDEPFEVRINLWDFLNEGCNRGKERPSRIWIDAMCIDQSAVEERNHQVAIMGKIYSRATTVVVWLGPATEAISFVLSKLCDTATDPIDAWVLYNDDEKSLMNKGIIDFLEKNYWRRLWIVQEFVLAEKIELWCGTHSVSESELERIYSEDVDIDAHPTVRLIFCRYSRKPIIEHERPQTPEEWSLEKFVEQFSCHMECHDERDSIYALMSLITEKERDYLDLIPDYSKTPAELYCYLIYKFSRVENPMIQDLHTYEGTMRKLWTVLRLDELDDEAVDRMIKHGKGNLVELENHRSC